MTQTLPIDLTDEAVDFAAQVERLSGAHLSGCLQCGKCTSGCPVSARADIRPHELVRLVQLGQRDAALSSRTIWECISCQTCITRCPQKVDIAAMNDTLRRLSLAAGKVHTATTVPVFNEIFLSTVRSRGRMFEMGLMTRYKLRTGKFMADVGKLPMMLRKGKLALLPPSVAGKGERKQLFQRAHQVGGRNK
jgi:heterodisulfide reductase subunit C/quinone-modifying oxidoreductase subunit QmoC